MKDCLLRGDIIKLENKQYRILQKTERDCIVIQMGTHKTMIQRWFLEDLYNLMDIDAACLLNEESDEKVVDIDAYRGRAKEIRSRFDKLAKDFLKQGLNVEWLLSRKEKSEFHLKVAVENHVSITTARRMLRLYLQNGMNLRGLAAKYYNCGGKGKIRSYHEGKRPGRAGVSTVIRDVATVEQFDEMIARYRASKGQLTVSMLYEQLVRRYYSFQQVVNGDISYIPYPSANRPTRKQLYYHIHKNIDKAQKYTIMNGYRKARNDIRPLFSDTIADLSVKGIGARYEMDEMETDFYLVSRYDVSKVIGRGILYLILDTYSKAITGYAIGLENNSWAGAEMALLNMVEDKVEVCHKKGIDIDESEWPIKEVLPTEFLVDNGAEYLSDQFEKFAMGNGIQLSFTPAAMGSMKGNIEQKFRQFNLKYYGALPGQILKDGYRQPHIRQARLNIEEFERIVIYFILNYNKNPMDHYQADKAVYESGIITSPIAIWNFSMERENGLKKVVDMQKYKLDLLHSDCASITRQGIVFKKMLYTCQDTEWLSCEMMQAAVGHRRKIKIKYDKRNMDYIYYEDYHGDYQLAWLNARKTINEKYQHLSLRDVEEIDNELRRRINENERLRLSNNINTHELTKEVVKGAKKKHVGPNDRKNIRQNRQEEKERLRTESNILAAIEGDISNSNPIQMDQEIPYSADVIIEMDDTWETTLDLIHQVAIEQFY